jgi:serine/threonine-protein kinase
MREDDGGYGYDERPDRRRAPQKKGTASTVLLVISGILILVGAIFLGRLIFHKAPTNTQVTAPQFVGLSPADAKSTAANAGVHITRGKDVACADQKKGTVCKQDPAYGAKLDKDGTVTLYYSKGAPLVSVPSVTGESEDDARSKLSGLGFKVTVKYQESTTVDAGQVISQDPQSGKKASGSTVNLVVAKKPDKSTLPNVIGSNVTDAVNALKKAGFTNVSQQQQDSDQPQGTVVKQTPDGNNDYDPTTQVTLYVSSGQASASPTTQVPNVVGKNVQHAEQILQQAGYTDIQFTPGSSQDPNARVMMQNPGANSQADPGSTTVTLTTVQSGGNLIGGAG